MENEVCLIVTVALLAAAASAGRAAEVDPEKGAKQVQLITTLRRNEELWIGDVRVCYGGRKRSGQAMLAIDAPPGVSIRRGELAGRPRIQEGEIAASAGRS